MIVTAEHKYFMFILDSRPGYGKSMSHLLTLTRSKTLAENVDPVFSFSLSKVVVGLFDM